MQRRHLLHSALATGWVAGTAGVLSRPALATQAATSAATPAATPAASLPNPRFALGVASGQPQAHTVVLWTRLTGADLPARVDVAWELAEDAAFTRIAARGVEVAVPADAHCVHAEPQGLQPASLYWYRFTAMGERTAAARTRTAPAPGAAVEQLRFAITSCQRYDAGHYAAWAEVAASANQGGLDVVLFLGDYVYEYPSNTQSVRSHTGGLVTQLDDYRARYAQYKSDPSLQAAHAACPWLLVWDDHEVDNDYAGLQGQSLQKAFALQRDAAYRAYWEHMPLPKAARPVAGGEMRMYGRLDWGQLARIHLLDDRQYRDPQACPRPGRGGSNTVPLASCAELADPRRTLLGAVQERWLADGWALDRPWNLLAQQTLMARFAWTDPSVPNRSTGGTYWTDGWDGYPAARARLLGTVASKKVPGLVVLGGDVHANYVADIKLDYDDPKAAVLASEFCGTSISSNGLAQSRVSTAMAFNPHMLHGRSDQRGYVRFVLQAGQLQAELRVVNDPADPASSLSTAARFVVEAGKPGPQRA
jgi:alkaline phosphatase D